MNNTRTNMTPTEMHQLLNFIYNKNIDIVKEIYQGKVPEYMTEHLTEKAQQYKENINNNSSAWLAFIGNLDSKNSQVLLDYIFKPKPIKTYQNENYK